MDAMWTEVSRLNLIESVRALTVPIYFLLGRHDHFVPPEISVDLLEALKAPKKRLVWFEQSRHEPFVDEPEKFNTVMTEVVCPNLPSELA
jgi:pimeloyl-ACP methyl ester carboxylesterase